jgi:uncharacterized protein (TIGR03067 family)
MLAIVIVTLLVGTGSARQDADNKDMEKFLGVWTIASQERGGEKVPEAKFKDIKVLFHADGKITVTEEGKQIEMTFKLRPAKMPKEIDTTEKKEGQELTHKGIYAFESGQLKICISRAPDDRPTEFATQAGTTAELFLLKREKN